MDIKCSTILKMHQMDALGLDVGYKRANWIGRMLKTWIWLSLWLYIPSTRLRMAENNLEMAKNDYSQRLEDPPPNWKCLRK